LKVKIHFGAFKASKSSLALLVVYVLSFFPSTIGLSLTVVDSIKNGIDFSGYIDALSAVLSGSLCLVLLYTYKGFTAFEYEQNFIFTSPLTPRKFLIASLLADVTVFSLFFYPVFLFLGISAFYLNLSIASILLMIAAMFLFASVIIFWKCSFSILESIYQSSLIKIVRAILIVFLLLPAIGLFSYFPIKYGELPYPSTFLAHCILGALHNKLPSVHVFAGLTSYFLASLALFLFSSKKNFFQVASCVPFVSPFDASIRTQTVKMGKNIRFFSKASKRITLNVHSKSLLAFLMKKEFIRMMRDGSLFTVLLFYVIVSVMSVAGGFQQTLQMWIILLAMYSFIVPPMLISNWRVTELDNLWIPLTSGMKVDYIVNSLLYDMVLTSFTIPMVVVLILTLLRQFNPLIPLVLTVSVSTISCSTNLYIVMRFIGKKWRGAPSLVISWVSLIVSGLLLTPTYLYVLFSFLLRLSNEMTALLSIPIITYSFLILIFFCEKIKKNAVHVEL
jgi:hypothetical protein